jgi:hypothetical protein
MLLTAETETLDSYAVESSLWNGFALSGHVAIAGRAADALAGQRIEICSDTDPSLRASGLIDAGGHFELATRDGSPIPEGTYRARLVLRSDGRSRVSGFRLPWQYLVYSSSGWIIDLPSDTLELVVRA